MHTSASSGDKKLVPPRVWVGRVLSALPALLLLASGSAKLAHVPQVLQGWTAQFGYPLSMLVPIGVAEIASALIYLIPRTAVLGAVLMTGFLGGAIATHVRVLDPHAVGPILLGILVWGGLYLRDERIRALLPLRKL